jgi:hypothetical protein
LRFGNSKPILHTQYGNRTEEGGVSPLLKFDRNTRAAIPVFIQKWRYGPNCLLNTWKSCNNDASNILFQAANSETKCFRCLGSVLLVDISAFVRSGRECTWPTGVVGEECGVLTLTVDPVRFLGAFETLSQLKDTKTRSLQADHVATLDVLPRLPSLPWLSELM